MKKIISLALTILMLISAFSTVVSADGYDLPFDDLVEGAWYMEGIDFCYQNGIVKGMTDTSFEPNGTLTRAQFVQMLAMYDGVELSLYDGLNCGFDDVKPGHWYNNAVSWAYINGYVSGMSETAFAPNDPITREQFARILYVYAESYGCDVDYRADLTDFEDESKVSSWAYSQVEWAVAVGIISGVSETALAPRNNATRAQACRMIMTFDDYFWTTEGKDELFYRLVDYIDANGSVSASDPAVTEIAEEADDVKLVLSYDRELDQIYYEYYSGAFEADNGKGGTYTDYLYCGLVLIDDIDESYTFTVQLDDVAKQSFYVYYGSMYRGGAVIILEEANGFDAEYINTNSEIIKTELNSFIMKHIANAGIPLDMMFKDVDYNRDGSYKIIVDYIMANYEFEMNGWYTYATFAGGTDFFADYNPISGELSFRIYDGLGDVRIWAEMTVAELGEAYYLEYGYWDTVSGKSADVIRVIFADHSEVYLSDLVGMTEEEAYALEEDTYALFCEGITELLSECGLTIADLYVTTE